MRPMYMLYVSRLIHGWDSRRKPTPMRTCTKAATIRLSGNMVLLLFISFLRPGIIAGVAHTLTVQGAI